MDYLKTMDFIERAITCIKVLLIILVICLAVFIGLIVYDYKYSEETYSYLSSEGMLSSTTFMAENEKPYAVTFENELYDVVYIPEELEEKAKELLQTKGKGKEYIKVTCTLKKTQKNMVFLSICLSSTYQIIDIEVTK